MRNIILFLTVLSIFFILGCQEECSDPAKDPNYIKVEDINVLFSPKKDIDDLIIYHVNNAKESIDVAIYDLTSQKIVDSLILARRNGISVRVYTDKNVSSEHEQPLIEQLENNGVEVLIATPENWSENIDLYRNAIMHNKFIVIDKKMVITGSYNFTNNAENNNRENIIIIPNEIIAEQYSSEFERYWGNP